MLGHCKCSGNTAAMLILRVMFAIIGTATLCEAASIVTNVEGNIVCPGEELRLICTGIGTSQIWTLSSQNGDLDDIFFVRSYAVGTNRTWNLFTLTLISKDFHNFQSMFFGVVTNTVNNTVVVCNGESSSDRTTIRIADEPSPPQNLSIKSVDHHSNDSTVVVTWEPASNDSRVDFYQYQLIDNLTEVRVSNTTNTTAVFSGVPYNVNVSFVISAFNCRGESEQVTVTLLINIVELLNSTKDFDQITSQLFTSTFQETTIDVVVIIPPSGNKTDLLLISTAVASTVIIMILLVVCAIVAVIFVKQLQRKRLALTHDVELYTEVQNGIPIYEAVDKMLNSSKPVNEADMSYVDMCGVSSDPVYDSAEVELEAANDVCKVDETLKSTECCDLSNKGTHYQNVQEEKYSHYSNLPQCQQPTGRSIYDD